jgi:hypothetical protein
MNSIEKVAWLLAIVMCPLFGLAQLDTNFISELGVNVNRQDAQYYRLVDEARLELKDYDLHHTLRRLETYNGKTFTIRQGPAKYFYPNGKLSQEGEYHKGIKTGEWKYYTHSGDKLVHKEIYEADDLVMHFFYDTIGGRLKSKGKTDKDGIKSGEWIEYHFRSDSVKWKNQYMAGKLHGEQTQYYREGTVKRIEVYRMGKLLHGKQFTVEGKKTNYFPEYQYPSVKFSIPTYLRAQCACIEALLKQENIELKCFVSEKGEASRWEINSSKDSICQNEILNAFKKIKKWRPARFEGQATESWYRYTMRYYAPKD